MSAPGLAHAVPALEALEEASGEASPLVALLQMLHTIQFDLMRSPSSLDADFSTLNASEVALLEGSCIAQAAAAVAAAEHKQPAEQQRHFLDLIARAVQHLKAILAKSKHGRLTGIAASSLGTVLSSALTAQGTAAGSPSASDLNAQQAPGSAQHAQHDTAQQTDLTDSQLRGALSDIMGAVTQVTKLPSAAVGKQGVALGLVALFGGSRVGHKGLPGALVDKPGWGSEAKQALQVGPAAFIPPFVHPCICACMQVFISLSGSYPSFLHMFVQQVSLSMVRNEQYSCRKQSCNGRLYGALSLKHTGSVAV